MLFCILTKFLQYFQGLNPYLLDVRKILYFLIYKKKERERGEYINI
nr:MAG TPA: hypothetical protein [Caudoviricetes sp.]